MKSKTVLQAFACLERSFNSIWSLKRWGVASYPALQCLDIMPVPNKSSTVRSRNKVEKLYLFSLCLVYYKGLVKSMCAHSYIISSAVSRYVLWNLLLLWNEVTSKGVEIRGLDGLVLFPTLTPENWVCLAIDTSFPYLNKCCTPLTLTMVICHNHDLYITFLSFGCITIIIPEIIVDFSCADIAVIHFSNIDTLIHFSHVYDVKLFYIIITFPSCPHLSIFQCFYLPHIIIHVLCFTLSIPLVDARVSHCKLRVALYLIPFICSVLIYALFFSADF